MGIKRKDNPRYRQRADGRWVLRETMSLTVNGKIRTMPPGWSLDASMTRISENMDTYLLGARGGEVSTGAGFDHDFLEIDSDLIEDNSHEQDEDDLFYYYANYAASVQSVDISAMASSVYHRLNNEIPLSDKFIQEYGDLLAEYGIDNPVKWDIRDASESDHWGYSLRDVTIDDYPKDEFLKLVKKHSLVK